VEALASGSLCNRRDPEYAWLNPIKLLKINRKVTLPQREGSLDHFTANVKFFVNGTMLGAGMARGGNPRLFPIQGRNFGNAAFGCPRSFSDHDLAHFSPAPHGPGYSGQLPQERSPRFHGFDARFGAGCTRPARSGHFFALSATGMMT
jgi:hypothetical protein